MSFVFEPTPVVSLPVVGQAERFPVHRIYCVGRNYEEHAKEMGFTGREPPFFFLKPNDSLVVVDAGQTGTMAYPSLTHNLHHEVELVVAIGQGGRNIKAADAAQPETWWDGRIFDAILLDAPCTASGIVRRHPDVRWLRRPTDSAQLAKIQAHLLKALWPLLAQGGRLLYCTCSVFKAEGDETVQAFLQRNTDAVLQPSPGHLIPGQTPRGLPVEDNALGEHDGFYYALLEKRRG